MVTRLYREIRRERAKMKPGNDGPMSRILIHASVYRMPGLSTRKQRDFLQWVMNLAVAYRVSENGWVAASPHLWLWWHINKEGRKRARTQRAMQMLLTALKRDNLLDFIITEGPHQELVLRLNWKEMERRVYVPSR